jgi:hypothetical protein
VVGLAVAVGLAPLDSPYIAVEAIDGLLEAVAADEPHVRKPTVCGNSSSKRGRTESWLLSSTQILREWTTVLNRNRCCRLLSVT